MLSYGSQVNLLPITGAKELDFLFLYKEWEVWIQTPGKTRVETEAEIRVMVPQTKVNTEARRSKEGFCQSL